MMQYESPVKRPRMVKNQNDATWSIVPSIHQAVTASQRFEIIHQLFRVLKYDVKSRACCSDPQIFMFLIESGVVNALSLQLGFVLNRHGASKEEIELLCCALDIFYRFSPDLFGARSLRVKGRETIRLLSAALERGVILPVVSIWHSCSSSELGTKLLVDKSSFLHSIGDLIRQGNSGDDALIEMLGVLKNVTYFGDEFRSCFVEHPEPLSSLTSLVERNVSEKAQERLSAVIRNLTLSPATRVVLAQRADVLTSIARLANNATEQTLQNLTNTMVSLAMDADSCLLILFHGDGMLVELLKRFLFFEQYSVVRRRAARCLRLMARETTVPLLVHDNKLMELLSNRALHDPDATVRAEAAEAFARCAGLIKAAMVQHSAVLEALTHLANNTNISADAMARAVKEQASHPENRVPLAHKKELLWAIAKISLSPESSATAKENVCNTFLELSSDEKSREVINTEITLNALVHSAEDRNERHGNIREAAVKTLLNLAVLPANRKTMAKQTRLIQSLLHFASTTTAEDLKMQVKLVLLKLAAEL